MNTAKKTSVLSVMLGLVAIVSSSTGGVCHAQQCYVEESQMLDGYGTHDAPDSVAIDGDVAVVGNSRQETATVYRRAGDGWSATATLRYDEWNSYFGIGVAIDGDVIAVSDIHYEDTGGVFVFRFNGTDWLEEDVLIGSLTPSGGAFGQHVAVSGDHIIARGNLEELAYVFEYDGYGWSERTTIPGRVHFAVSNGVLLTRQSNRLDVYRLDELNWNLSQSMDVPDGYSMDIEDGVAIVGFRSREEDPRVYRDMGEEFVEEARLGGLVDPGRQQSVAISRDHAVVVDGRLFEGHVLRAYRFDGAEWGFVGKLVTSDNPGGMNSAVAAIDGNTAMLHNGMAGHTYIYDDIDLIEGGCEPCELIDRFQATCKRGEVVVIKVKGDFHPDERFSFDINGQTRRMAFNRHGKGKLRLRDQSGRIEVAMIECPNNNAVVDCQ